MPKANPNRQKPHGTNGGEQPPTPRETAAYIGPMVGELAALARRSGLTELAYLLEMAQIEAANITQPTKN